LPNHHGLDEVFIELEIKRDVDELPSEKSHGPDSFTCAFYRMCWEIIKADIIAAMHSIHSLTTGPLPKLNGALLTLLPKKDPTETPGDYWPISLIHSFTKLVSKVLALLLDPFIDALVSNAQSMFIKWRCIQDKFLYVRNLARAYHRKRRLALLLKLDITKAFNSISWEYLLDLL
jgi:hypothetical protein